MFEFKCLIAFIACFLCAMLFTAVYFILKLRREKKRSFKTGVYAGKDIEVDHKISEYLKDDMEHHSSKAFKSIENPEDR